MMTKEDDAVFRRLWRKRICRRCNIRTPYLALEGETCLYCDLKGAYLKATAEPPSPGPKK